MSGEAFGIVVNVVESQACCETCKVQGIEWGLCASCGEEFPFVRWDVGRCGPLHLGVSEAERMARELDSFESPFWAGVGGPIFCDVCAEGSAAESWLYRPGAFDVED